MPVMSRIIIEADECLFDSYLENAPASWITKCPIVIPTVMVTRTSVLLLKPGDWQTFLPVVFSFQYMTDSVRISMNIDREKAGRHGPTSPL